MNLSIHTIYIVVNKINKKIYIGYDSSWPNRKNRHERASSNPNDIGYNDVFHKAMRKYGGSNFEWNILYQSLDGQHCLNVMEKYFIAEYNSYIHSPNSNGYNMTLGGDGVLGLKKTEESKLKISEKSAKIYKFWYNGELIIIKNLKKYCMDNNIGYNNLLRLFNKKKQRFRYKNYYPYDNEKNFDEALINYNTKIQNSMSIMGEKHSKTYTLRSPSGELITFKNLAKFARDNNLNQQSLKQVAMGVLKSNRGWTLP